MDAIIRSSARYSNPIFRDTWDDQKSKLETTANYAGAGGDAVVLTKLIADLGGAGAKAYVKHYGGKPHIIIGGRPGLRKVLTGTKYGVKNPKVIAMGLGKAGAAHSAKMGGILSVVLLTGYRVADYVLTDEATLGQLIGRLATDVVKVGIATGASIMAANAIVTAGVTVAVGPIAAVLIVGVLSTIILTAIDEQFHITDRLVAALEEINQTLLDRIESKAEELATEALASVIDYTAETARRIAIDFARHGLERFLRPTLR
ncbi:hypothetical protein NBRC116495_08810 [Aurantivibrio plasticivorans]